MTSKNDTGKNDVDQNDTGGVEGNATVGGGEAADELAELGARLREAREYLALSQQYVSDRTGIARSAVSDIERGQRKVDSLELKKFSKLYGYPVSYFLGAEEVEPEVHAWARAMTDLTDGDRAELMRFAQFLRFSADAERRAGGRR